MISQFESLTDDEKDMLLKAPALVSVRAACLDKQIHPARKADALKLAHLKTFTAAPDLMPYYHEVEKHFKENLEKAEKLYCPYDEVKKEELEKEVEKVMKITAKLNASYAVLLQKSL